MKKIITSLIVSTFLFSGIIKAQETKPQIAESIAIIDSVKTLPFFQRPMGISVCAGTQGFGLDYKARISSKFLVRLGFAYMGMNYVSSYTLSNSTLDLTMDANFTNIHLLAEWQPWARHSFRIVGGLGYFTTAKVSGKMQPTNNYTYGKDTITGKQIGQINLDVDWQGIAPYLGIGLGKGMPTKKKVCLNLDLGYYLLTTPKGTMSGTNFLAGNDANNAQLNTDLAPNHWLPVLQLNLIYRISK